MPAALSPLPPDYPAPEALLQTLLDVSLTAVGLLRPLYAAGTGELLDFALDYLNPAGQRLAGLPQRPAATLLTRFEQAGASGAFAFCRRVFETEEAGHYDFYYPTAGVDDYYRLAARRHGPLLVVSFLDPADHRDRSADETALRQSQAREQAARAEAERQRQQLHTSFMEAPACIATLTGPAHVFSLANPLYQQLFGGRQLVGKAIREAVPELEGQPFFGLLDNVYRTGEPFYGKEQVAYVDHTNSGRLDPLYFNFTYQAIRDAAGTIAGVLIFAYDVTAQVLARQQVQDLNGELATANEELQAANEEFLINNADLARTQQQLQLLNAGLEARVAARTQAAQAAQAEAERQRQRLERFFMQAPAAICILDGPELVYELVNPRYQQLFPGRQLLGKALLTALPELTGHSVADMFFEVYATGVTHEEQGLLIPLARPEDGQLEDRYFNFIQQARYDEHGHIDGVLVFAFEVTEEVQARQQVQALADELRTTNRQLTRTNVDLDNFIYTASHDLKAPITNIEGLLAALQTELPAPSQPGDVPYILELMQGAVMRFKTTLDHLSDVTKLQKEHDLPTTDVPLAAMIEAVRLDLQPQLAQAGAELVVEVAGCPSISFSAKNLRSVVYNLLSNALKYRHPDRTPRIRIGCGQQGDYSVLWVQDNGLGIETAQLPELFTMFRRLHSHVEGSGLGLYMVKRSVENAGGKVGVTSEVGVGSTFSVYFRR